MEVADTRLFESTEKSVRAPPVGATAEQDVSAARWRCRRAQGLSRTLRRSLDAADSASHGDAHRLAALRKRLEAADAEAARLRALLERSEAELSSESLDEESVDMWAGTGGRGGKKGKQELHEGGPASIQSLAALDGLHLLVFGLNDHQ